MSKIIMYCFLCALGHVLKKIKDIGNIFFNISGSLFSARFAWRCVSFCFCFLLTKYMALVLHSYDHSIVTVMIGSFPHWEHLKYLWYRFVAFLQTCHSCFLQAMGGSLTLIKNRLSSLQHGFSNTDKLTLLKNFLPSQNRFFLSWQFSRLYPESHNNIKQDALLMVPEGN